MQHHCVFSPNPDNIQTALCFQNPHINSGVVHKNARVPCLNTSVAGVRHVATFLLPTPPQCHNIAQPAFHLQCQQLCDSFTVF